MNNSEIENVLQCLKSKKLSGVIYRDKNGEQDSCLELLFSDSYKLIIQTFWRIMDNKKILAMDSERYLLQDYNAPLNNYLSLSLTESLLGFNLEYFRKTYIDSIVEDVQIGATKDLVIKFKNGLIIQGIINCRCDSYMYYGLYCGEREVLKMCVDWKNINK